MLDPQAHAIIHKVLRRLVPFCCLCYILNYLDRINISMAQFPMAAPHTGVPGFDAAVYARGVSIFFLGYCLFELPSNLIQQRVGPRRWIARIMISWGIISTAFMFTDSPATFYILRFLLGVAEAGFFPGLLLYFCLWVPHEYRARALATFLTSTALAGVIGNPLSGYILHFTDAHRDFLHAHHLSLEPWQWLFLLEGLPTIFLGLFVLFHLTDTPAQARWLTTDERSRLIDILSREQAQHPAHHLHHLKFAFASPHTWILSLLYSLAVYGFYTLNYFIPKIIRETLLSAGALTTRTPSHLADLYVGLLSAIPFSAAVVGLIVIGRHSDRASERKIHTAFACVLTAAGLAVAALAPLATTGAFSAICVIAGLSLSATGAFGMFGPFWSLPPQLLAGTAAAAAIAIINSLGNFVGGFLSPLAYSHFSRPSALLIASGCALAAALLAALAPIPSPAASESNARSSAQSTHELHSHAKN